MTDIMPNSENKTLTFRIGEESYPTVMSEVELMKTPFADTVVNARKRLEDLAESLYDVRSNGRHEEWINETPCNIITFLGDRGSGKTSCMRTLVGICSKEHEDWLFASEIDPSFFDEKHNILELLIGALYGIFKRDIADLSKKNRKQQDALREIHELFIKVKSAMKYLEDHHLNDDDNEYEADALRHLDEGGRIRLILKDLIDRILAYKEKRLLVISIDDLDLNIKQSYVMMEHIRKFLLIPNLALIIAAKYEQLFNSICLDLSDTYKALDYRVSHKDIAEMSERYLNKLLPLNQRFNMPETESYVDSTLIILNQDGTPVYENEESVQLRVPSMIFEKTRFLFYNFPGMPSRIIPRNLRDLRMLVTMLTIMKPADEAHEQNKRLFKEYFFKEWMAAIDPDFRNFARILLQEENLAKINKLVISNLYDFFLAKTESPENLKKEIEELRKESKDTGSLRTDSHYLERRLLLDILNPSNSFWNVSIGDVVFIINLVKRTQDSNKALDLLFFVETFYSMKLYETYDKMTALTSTSGLQMPQETDSSAPELKTGVIDDTPDYFRLVGGSFFALTGDFLTPMPQYAEMADSRETTLINAKFLMDEIRRLESEFDSCDGDVDKLPKGFAESLRLCEFFMLCISHREDQRGFKNHRLYNEPLYFTKFGSSAKHLIFDITAPFFYAVCPALAYKRFSEKIYKIAIKTPNSMVRLIRGYMKRERPNKTWEVMSKVAIRNMEVLEDLTSWLHNRREENKPDGKGRIGVMQKFFRQFQISETAKPNTRYSVKTYDKYQDEASSENAPEEEKYHTIHFFAISLLYKVLSDLYPLSKPNAEHNSDEDKEDRRLMEERKNLFDSIFAYDAIFPQRSSYAPDEVKKTLRQYCGPWAAEEAMKSIQNDSLSCLELANILAEIRVRDGVDFDKRLPLGVEIYYDTCVQIEFDSNIQPLKEERQNLEVQLKDIEDEKDLANELIKHIRKEKSDLEKERIRQPKELNRIEREISETKASIDFLQERVLKEFGDRTEIRRLNKEIEKGQLKLISLEATRGQISQWEKKYLDAENRIQTSIDTAVERRDDLEKSRRKILRDLDKCMHRIKNMEEKFNSAKPVASLM